MAEPPRGKAYIPVDLRGQKRIRDAVMIAIDDDAEPRCVALNLITDTTHLEIRLDEAALTELFDGVLTARLQLARDIALKKGAARAARRRKG